MGERPKMAEELLNLRLDSNINEDGSSWQRPEKEEITLKIDLSLYHKPGAPVSSLKLVEEPRLARRRCKFSRAPEMPALVKMLTENHRELICHPVTETFLQLKWQKLRHFFYLSLVYQCIFSMIVAVLLLVTVREAKSWKYPREFRTAVKWTLVSLAIPIVAKLLFDIYRLGPKTFLVKDWGQVFWSCPRRANKSFPTFYYPKLSKRSLARLLQIVLVISTMGSGSLENSLRTHEHYHLLAWTVVISWMVSLSLARDCPRLGIYILTLDRVVRDVLRFVLASLPIYLGFGFAFYALFGRVGGNKVFNDPLNSFFSVMAMAFGYFHFAHNKDEIYHRELMDGFPGRLSFF